MLWEYRERAHNLLSHVCLGARLLCLCLKFVIAEIRTAIHIERLLEKSHHSPARTGQASKLSGVTLYSLTSKVGPT